MRSMVHLSLPGAGRHVGLVGRVGPLGLVAFAMMAVCGAVGGAAAQGKLDARYTATLAGVPIGTGAWTVEIGDDQYMAEARGMTAGLLRMFSNGHGTGASRGLVRGEALIPTGYVSSITNDKRIEELRIVMSAGA